MNVKIECKPCGKSVSKNIYEKHCLTDAHKRNLKRTPKHDVSDSESDSDEENPPEKKHKNVEHLKDIRNKPRSVSVTNVETNENVVYPSLYAVQKACSINANLVKLFCERSQLKEKKKQKAYIENKDGSKFKMSYVDDAPVVREKLTPEQKREKQLAYNKVYNKVHKNEIAEYHRTRVDCDCGGHYMQVNKAKHVASIKHQKYLETAEHLPEEVAESEEEEEEAEEVESESEEESETERKIISTKTTSSDVEEEEEEEEPKNKYFKLPFEIKTN